MPGAVSWPPTWTCWLLGNQILLKDEQKKKMSDHDKLAHLGQFKLD